VLLAGLTKVDIQVGLQKGDGVSSYPALSAPVATHAEALGLHGGPDVESIRPPPLTPITTCRTAGGILAAVCGGYFLRVKAQLPGIIKEVHGFSFISFLFLYVVEEVEYKYIHNPRALLSPRIKVLRDMVYFPYSWECLITGCYI
jgi:hypothetical protein